jgi:hypothetical protein
LWSWSQVSWPPGLPASPVGELSSRFGLDSFEFAASSEKLSPFTAGVPCTGVYVLPSELVAKGYVPK